MKVYGINEGAFRKAMEEELEHLSLSVCAVGGENWCGTAEDGRDLRTDWRSELDQLRGVIRRDGIIKVGDGSEGSWGPLPVYSQPHGKEQ
jgi:hypothetical protein